MYNTENNNEMNQTTGQNNKQKKDNSFEKKTAKLVGGALLFGILTGVGFQGYGYLANGFAQSFASGENTSAENTQATQDKNVVATNTSSTESKAGDISNIVENVMPSIVAIDCTSTASVSDFFGRSYSQDSTGSGSGIIIGQNDKELLIVTNNHVIAGDNAKVSVTFNDNTKASAVIKGTDSSADLAVISVDMTTLSDSTKNAIKVATLGDSSTTKVGEVAIAIGNALGYGQSVTVGYISAKDREVAMEDSNMSLLQTDAAINPGNSGGALLNSKGEVIGINSVKYASEEVEGMGYAIPISDAVPIINDLMNREQLLEAEQSYLGMKGKDVSSDSTNTFQMPEGIYVGEVTKGSPAEKAGLMAGNIIVGVNDRTVKTMKALQEILTYTKAGTEITLKIKVLENGEYKDQTLKVTLGSKADSDQEAESEDNSGQQQKGYPMQP